MQYRTEQPLPGIEDKLREEFLELRTVYRFGSFGAEYERPESDLDLAVCAGKPLPPMKLWRMAQKLAVDVGRALDLVELALASTVM